MPRAGQRPAVMETLARSTVSMTEAEVSSSSSSAAGSRPRRTTCGSSRRRPPRSCPRAAGIGALLGASGAQSDALRGTGSTSALAFQISDDSLDFVADQDRLGKAIGAIFPKASGRSRSSPCRAGDADRGRARQEPAQAPRPRRRRGRGDPTLRGGHRGRSTRWPAPRYARRGKATRSVRASEERRRSPWSRTSWSTAIGDVAVITLTTDFGARDTYVAEMKAAILASARRPLVDITHEIAPHDARGRARAGSAAPSFPVDTITWRWSDPASHGAAWPRRRRPRGVFIGPDNGLFTPSWAARWSASSSRAPVPAGRS